MTDHSALVTGALRILDGNVNGGTPYDTLVLDIEETDVSLHINTIFGNDGTPMDVWHGRTRRFSLARGRCAIDLDALRTDLAEGGRLAVLIDRIQSGLTVEWDGSNMRGSLNDDAAEADETLEHALYRGDISYADERAALWDESEWIADESRSVITADTTDEEIDAYLARVRDDCPSDVFLTGDARDDLIEMRDEARATRDEEAA